MDLKSILQNKKNIVTELFNKGENLRNQWKKNFTEKISAQEKKSIYLNDFLWHCFSYEKLSCLENEDAVEAFNNKQKKDCYVFYQHTDNAFMLKNAENITAEDFENESDVYVVDKDFTWTYVHTHEAQCGPYFHECI